MKKLVMFLIVVVLILISRGATPLPDPSPIFTTVKIERHDQFIPIIQSLHGVKFGCQDAVLDYEKRLVIMQINQEGYFGSYGGDSNWLWQISINGDQIILHLPDDADYNVYIGDKKHILTKK